MLQNSTTIGEKKKIRIFYSFSDFQGEAEYKIFNTLSQKKKELRDKNIHIVSQDYDIVFLYLLRSAHPDFP